ncbi:MAG: helix-hairpin-helix domain-containing protein [Halobacteriales archaeon]
MKNAKVAEMFREIADFLEIQEVGYKPRAYRRAARNVVALSEGVAEIHERGELQEIDGVGESIAEKIAEYLETGEMSYYEELKADLPIDIEAITRVEGVGPKTAKTLYLELGVETLDDLEGAAEAGEIAQLEGFGEKSQQNVLDHIDLARAGEERLLLGRAFPVAKDVRTRLAGADPFDRVEVVGSFRRRRPTVGDIDVLAASEEPHAAMDVFCDHEDVEEVLNRGETKASVLASGDLRMDLRVVDAHEYGAALVYFTGSKDHNIALRNRAIDRDWKLNEYGLFDVSDVEDDGDPRAGERLAGQTEEEVYAALDLSWIPPTLREDTGEVEAAATGTLPDPAEVDDVRGDLQVHTDFSDGTASVAEMAAAADERGLEYLLVTDHGPNAPIPSRLDGDAFREQRDAVAAVNDDPDVDVRVLQGIEAEITADGVDVPDDWLSEIDLVVAGLHGRLDDPTDRLVAAMESGVLDVLAHPSNRLINEREPLDLDWDAVMATAASEGVAVEINAQPKRLDLDWARVREYRGDVSLVVSTDAHGTPELDYLHLGVSQAQRGWCEPGDVLNTRPVEELLSWFG